MNKIQQVKYISVTPPAAIANNTSPTTAEIDTLGYDYCTIVAYLGATDIAMTALKVTESDTAGSGHADVTGLVFGTSNTIDGSASTLPSATDDNKFFVFQVDLRGRKRYLDVTATIGNGSTGAYLTILAMLSRGESNPATSAGMGAAAVLTV